MDAVHQAYLGALMACKRARDQGKQYIAFQKLKQGGYRLMTSREEAASYGFGFGTTEWAQNLLYRLVDECLADFTYDDIDAYLAKLNEVTAPAAGAVTGAGGGRGVELREENHETHKCAGRGNHGYLGFIRVSSVSPD